MKWCFPWKILKEGQVSLKEVNLPRRFRKRNAIIFHIETENAVKHLINCLNMTRNDYRRNLPRQIPHNVTNDILLMEPSWCDFVERVGKKSSSYREALKQQCKHITFNKLYDEIVIWKLWQLFIVNLNCEIEKCYQWASLTNGTGILLSL